MFRHAAHWYDVIYGGVDYETQAHRVLEVIRDRHPTPSSLLDVACGTGRHLEVFSRQMDCAGVDIEPGLLQVARSRLSSQVALHEADMRDFDLGRQFDAVACLFSSIGYVGNVEGLYAAVGRMAEHLAPGGVLVLEPWILPEAWDESGKVNVEVFERGADKIVRVTSSHRRDRLSILDMHYVDARPGQIEAADERHELGLFTREEYLDAVASQGMRAEWDPEGLRGRGLIVGVLSRSPLPQSDSSR